MRLLRVRVRVRDRVGGKNEGYGQGWRGPQRTRGVHAGAALDLDHVERVAAGGGAVEHVLCHRAVRLGLEEVTQRLLLRLDLGSPQPLNRHAAPSVTQQAQLGPRSELGQRREQVVQVLVVYLKE
eukprot:scaffold114536_cov60-Phaeocystis_antarctica.AAC.5